MTSYDTIHKRLHEMMKQLDNFEINVKKMWDNIILTESPILTKLKYENENDGYQKFYKFMMENSPGYYELVEAIDNTEELLNYLAITEDE